jgi:hypothetical protein
MDENGEGYVFLVMSSNSLPCIDLNRCEYFCGIFHHPMAENDKHQKWKRKNACQVVVLDGSMAN